MRQIAPRYQVFAILHDGRIWHGDCAMVDKGVICVRSAYGGETVRVGRRKPERVAAEVLEGLVREWRKKEGLK